MAKGMSNALLDLCKGLLTEALYCLNYAVDIGCSHPSITHNFATQTTTHVQPGLHTMNASQMLYLASFPGPSSGGEEGPGNEANALL